jgi:hypothetical protein
MKAPRLLIILPFLVLSCQTGPKLSDMALEETNYIPLEGGALVYIFADVKAAKPILDLVPIDEMKNKRLTEVLEKTNTAVAALYPPESGRRFQVVAQGAYPSFRAGMALGMSSHWKKQRSAAGFSYWYSSADRLSAALNSKQAFAAAWTEDKPGDPVAASTVKLPDDFGEFRRGAILSCWLEDPDSRINRIFQAMGIPLQLPAEQLFVSLFPATDQKYEAMIRMRFSSATQARALVALFSLARNLMALSPQTGETPMTVLAAILFANPPAQNDRDLNIKTAGLTEKQISLLFDLFSVY